MISFRHTLLVVAALAVTGAWHAAAVAQSSIPLDAVAAYDKGKQLQTEGKDREAIAEFNKAIAIEQAYPDAFIAKGESLKNLKDYGSAATAYSTALNLGSPTAEAYNGRGECYLELRQIDLASTDFNSALEKDPYNAKVLSNIGHIQVNYAQDPAGAIPRLDDAIALNDKDARAYRDRGYAHVLLRDFAQAEADVKRATEVDPSDYENFQMMANVYSFQDKYAPAIEAMTKAIEAYKPEKSGDPEKFIAGYLARADARLKLGEQEKDAQKSQAAFEAVIADAKAVLDLYDDRFPESGRAYFRQGRGERMLQRYSDAVDSLTRAIQLVPTGQDIEYLADAYMYRGICWFYIGEADLARGDFEQASATGSGYQDPRVFLWIGFTHHKQGDYREAINSYNEAIAKSPGLALAHVNKGRAYIDLKEYNRAIECFNDAIRAEPSMGEHYYNVGFAYMQLKEFQKAVDFLNLAIHKDNPQPKMYSLMASALRQLDRNDLADEYQRKADEAQPQASSGS